MKVECLCYLILSVHAYPFGYFWRNFWVVSYPLTLFIIKFFIEILNKGTIIMQINTIFFLILQTGAYYDYCVGVQGATPTWFLTGWTVFRRNPGAHWVLPRLQPPLVSFIILCFGYYTEHGRGYVDIVLVWLMLCSFGSMLDLSQSSGTLGRRIFFLIWSGPLDLALGSPRPWDQNWGCCNEQRAPRAHWMMHGFVINQFVVVELFCAG